MRAIAILALALNPCAAFAETALPDGWTERASLEVQRLIQGKGEGGGGPVWLRAQLARGLSSSSVDSLLRSSKDGRVVCDAAGRSVYWLRQDPAELAGAAVQLLGRPEVVWIERYRLMVPDNDNSSWLIQSGSADLGRTVWDRGLSGIGQVVGVADLGLDMDACQFRFSGAADAVTHAITSPQPPEALVDRPDNKVITYYVLGSAEAYDSASAGYHGTHSAGNAVGDDYHHSARSAGTDFHDPQDGMAPGAQLVFQDIGGHDGYLWGLSVASMYDILDQAYRTGARIHSNSYGASGASPRYDIDSASIDEVVWDHNDLLVLFSAGNYGPDPQTVNGTGAVAKNTLTVGASGPVELDFFGSMFYLQDDLLFFSSQGPTADGRRKPDLVAPGMTFSATTDRTTEIPLGCCDRDGNEMFESASDDDNCNVDQDWPAVGTSFATPVTAGAAALVRQYFTDGYWVAGRADFESGFSPTAALLKATLIHGAVPLTGEVFLQNIPVVPRPDHGQGYGLLRLEQALWFEGDDRHTLVLDDVRNPVPGDPMAAAEPAAWPHAGEPLASGDEREWLLPPLDAGGLLKTCLVWSDPPAAPGADPALVNDLDLSLEGPAGELYLGNRGFGADGLAEPIDGEEPDRLNNVECIFFNSPVDGRFRVRVVAHAVPGIGQPGSEAQGFGLVVSGPFRPPTPIRVEPARLAPGETAEGVLVTGRDFTEGVQLDFGPGIQVEGLEVSDETSLRIARLVVADDAEPGDRNLSTRSFHSLTAVSQGLFSVGGDGCSCGVGPSGSGVLLFIWLLALGWLRRRG